MPTPRQVKIAIALSWLVLVVDSFSSFWQIAEDPEASTDLQFKSLWIGAALTSTALTALFIFQASRRRNWGRIALLVWTVGSWCLWFVWPPRIADYAWWKWGVSGTLVAMEFVALVLLFRGEGARWYSLPSGATNAL